MTATNDPAMVDGRMTGSLGLLPLESLMAGHRRAERQYRLAAVGLLLAGLLLVALGWFAVLPWLPALVVGVVTAAVAVFPYREGVERGGRVEGLQVLQDEWRELAQSSSTPDQDADRFIELMWKLYGRR